MSSYRAVDPGNFTLEIWIQEIQDGDECDPNRYSKTPLLRSPVPDSQIMGGSTNMKSMPSLVGTCVGHPFVTTFPRGAGMAPFCPWIPKGVQVASDDVKRSFKLS